MDDNQNSSTPLEEEEQTSAFSLKNLLIRVVCLIALGYAVKVFLDRGQLIFASVVGVCLAGFAFSLVMYLVKVIKGIKKK